MAIDSAEKRRSVAGISVPALFLGVTPNASQDVEWRQQAGWGYSGMGAEEIAAPQFVFILQATGERYTLRSTDAEYRLVGTTETYRLVRTN